MTDSTCLLHLYSRSRALGGLTRRAVRRASHSPHTPSLMTRRAPRAARFRRTARPFPCRRLFMMRRARSAPRLTAPLFPSHRPCALQLQHIDHVYFFRLYGSRRHSASVALALLPPCTSLHLPPRVTSLTCSALPIFASRGKIWFRTCYIVEEVPHAVKIAK